MSTRRPLAGFVVAAALLAVPVAGPIIGPAAAQPATTQPAAGTTSATQGGDFYRFPLGDARITALSDGTVPQDLPALLRNVAPQEIDALLRRAHQHNPIEVSINAFLIELDDRKVLVDTGAGALFGALGGGKLPESLAAIGVAPEEITDILITHIHTDHSGGLVVGGRRTFPNAVIHVGKPDADFFLDPTNAEKTGYDRRYFDEAALMLSPYVQAGALRPFSGTAEVLPGITGTIHSGHTPGSAFYTVTSGGQSLTFIGDIIHAAPVQFPTPSVTIVYDQNPAAAAQTRLTAFKRFARDGTLVAAPHLPFPGIGRLRTDPTGQGFEWLPVPYRNRD